ncbi:MAG: IreB family regulatory phosphoprotein [Oscillospiraceae bacterium]|nr:IreB family regulatory phosphoprotein [Oscillospiraceae bacterium]
MLDENVLSILNDIADSIKETGLDPYEQLYGYATTGNELYITRHRGARDLILKMNVFDIVEYLEYKNSI